MVCGPRGKCIKFSLSSEFGSLGAVHRDSLQVLQNTSAVWPSCSGVDHNNWIYIWVAFLHWKEQTTGRRFRLNRCCKSLQVRLVCSQQCSACQLIPASCVLLGLLLHPLLP